VDYDEVPALRREELARGIESGKIYSINNAGDHFKPSNECLGIAEDAFIYHKMFSQNIFKAICHMENRGEVYGL